MIYNIEDFETPQPPASIHHQQAEARAARWIAFTFLALATIEAVVFNGGPLLWLIFCAGYFFSGIGFGLEKASKHFLDGFMGKHTHSGS